MTIEQLCPTSPNLVSGKKILFFPRLEVQLRAIDLYHTSSPKHSTRVGNSKMDPLLERLLRENGLTLSELKIPSQRGVLQMKERFESTAEERFAKWQPRWKKNDGEEIHLSTSVCSHPVMVLQG